jgi:hypothetical protein
MLMAKCDGKQTTEGVGYRSLGYATSASRHQPYGSYEQGAALVPEMALIFNDIERKGHS